MGKVSKGADKAATYYRVRVRDLFPPDKPGVPELLRLMAAVNDLRTLQKLWLFAESRPANTKSEQEIIQAEHIYLFRLTCGTLYEAGIAFQDFRRAFAKAGILGEVESLPHATRMAFQALDGLFAEGFEKKGWGNVLCQLRSSVFHYAKPKVFRRELQEHDELGDLVIGEIVGISRYLFVDDLQVQITLRPQGIDNPDQQRALAQTVSETMRYLGQFVDGMVIILAKTHAAAIVEERRETVDPQLLWSIQY